MNRLVTIAGLMLIVAACGGADTDTVSGGSTGLFPDVLAVAATHNPDDTWTFDVTLSSPYDTAQRYADAWRVLAPDGSELGVRVLTHHHGDEQPFTRSVNGVKIPSNIDTVTVEGRDQLSGWGGATIDVTLDR